MSIVEALILGIIQGLTEFLPVSSSGHLELGKAILDVNVKDPLLFSIVVHGATALSTIVIFRKDILILIQESLRFQWNESTSYIAKIVISMIPVGVVGVLYEDKIEVLFERQIFLVGLMLLVTGALLLWTMRAHSNNSKVSFLHATIIGISQAIAILPGISRSGATISTALLLGVDRDKAARFSFLMVLPPILGALLLKVKKYFEESQQLVQGAVENGAVSVGSIPLIIGFLAAFFSGLVACQWMINLVRKSKLIYFAIYCLVVGLIAVGISVFK